MDLVEKLFIHCRKAQEAGPKSALTQRSTTTISGADQLNFDSIRTKHMVNVLGAFKIDKSALIILDSKNEIVEKSGQHTW